MGGKSTPHMVEVSNEEDNNGHQATSPIQMEFVNNYQNIDVVDFDVDNQDAPSAQTPHHLFEETMNEDVSYNVQHNTNQFVPDTIIFDTSDSTPSGSISPDTREAMNTLIADLGCLPIHANQQELTDNQSLISDSQLPIDIPITDIVVRSKINTPHARIRMPSRNCKSPCLTSFGSSEKGKAVMTDGFLKLIQKRNHQRINTNRPSSLSFEMMDYVVAYMLNKNWFYAMSQPKNCWTDKHIDVIFYYLRKKSKLQSMDLYRYYNNEADDDISTQEHLDRARAVSVHERSIINVMKGFSIPAGLPWHLVDDVYIPINYDENFHWVLAIVELNKRDCGLYVATFAEFLSDQLVIPPDTYGHLANYLRNKYAALLWRYGSDKVNGGYISENDDPPKPKGQFTTPTEDDIININ
ncbi:uncharacterized protein [Solanum lycopersicum]|uniref:uncharacterized protein n=1 Tax=Solanum lycopersicum TaxID=4081 RepID=UPI003747B3F9